MGGWGGVGGWGLHSHFRVQPNNCVEVVLRCVVVGVVTIIILVPKNFGPKISWQKNLGSKIFFARI